MFRFKNSNFYANQKCIPDYTAVSYLEDGMCVEVDVVDRTALSVGHGEYIVLSESLNRNEVHAMANGFGVCHNGVHAGIGASVRLYELKELEGVEFVTDNFKPTGAAPYGAKPAGFSIGDWFGYNDDGVLIPEGTANDFGFVVTAVEGDHLVLTLYKRPSEEN